MLLQFCNWSVQLCSVECSNRCVGIGPFPSVFLFPIYIKSFAIRNTVQIQYGHINSLALGGLNEVIFKLILVIVGWGIS